MIKTKRNIRAIANTVMLSTIVGWFAVSFNACSSEHDKLDQGSLVNPTGFWTCEDKLDESLLFSKTYHNFLQNRCAECHMGGGQGPGAFANSGLETALVSFNNLGFSKINSRALDGHRPASGPHNKPDIDNLTAKYVDGLATIEACSDKPTNELGQDQDGPTRIQFRSKAINPNPMAPVTITWTISSDSIANTGFVPANFLGKQIAAEVQVYQKPGILNYIISNPRLITTSGDIRIKSILFKINGKPTPAQRTFYLLTKDIRAWNGTHPDFAKPDPNPATPFNENQYQASLISGGSLVVLGEVRSTDVISMSIDEIENITLPPPDLGPAIRFGQTTQQVTEGYRIVEIPIVLDRPATALSSAEIVYGADTTLKDECCRSTRNDDGQAIQVRHFDRDIQDFDVNPDVKINRRLNFDSPANRGRFLVSFREGESSQTLRIKIVEDDRDEANEVLHLRIDNVKLSKLTAGANNQDFRLTIVDNDAAYNGAVETYTELLSDGGLLEQECLRCHNSVLFRGGYDITNYEILVNRGILIPGSPLNSLMFRRMDANTPGLAPMPLTGLLDPLDRRRVSDWIQLGAPNN